MPRIAILRKDHRVQRYLVSKKNLLDYEKHTPSRTELKRIRGPLFEVLYKKGKLRDFWITGSWGLGYEREVSVKVRARTIHTVTVFGEHLSDISGPTHIIDISKERPTGLDDYYVVRRGELHNISGSYRGR